MDTTPQINIPTAYLMKHTYINCHITFITCTLALQRIVDMQQSYVLPKTKRTKTKMRFHSNQTDRPSYYTLKVIIIHSNILIQIMHFVGDCKQLQRSCKTIIVFLYLHAGEGGPEGSKPCDDRATT